ncbi:Membrane-associated phospholipid phosphatase, putative [Rivularia sp. IAM M-261]|nr:Membrane-associated phospholipid phosphatase, putative [Rivularia sp. IAM M-261]
MILNVFWGVEPIIFIQRFFGESWNWFFQTITQLGSVEGIALVFAMTFWIFGRRLAWCLVGSVVFVTAVNLIIWSIIDVPRPNHPEIKVYKELNISSFPSGHTGTATIFWGTLTALTNVPLVITVLVVLLVMLSRLYLGVHYFGDVIGGLIIGLILLKIYPRLWDIVWRWFNGRTFKLFLVLSLSVPIAVFPFADSFPEGWEVFGASVGAAIGIPLELCYVHYSPANISKQKQAFKLIIGLSVLIMIIFSSRFISNDESVRDAISFGLGAFWILFLAPMLFKYIGLSRS